MAALHSPSVSFLNVFLPVARASLFPPARTHPLLEQLQRRASKALNNPILQQLQRQTNNAFNNSILPAVFLPIPTLLGELWDGLLKAVPKKKTSHMKKRHRQLASGKALKDVTALNTCSSCGRQKRAHVLCEYCVKSIKQWFTNGFRTPEEVEESRAEKEMDKELGYEEVDKDLGYEEVEGEPRLPSGSTPSSSKPFPTAAARRGTSNEMQWYNSQEKFMPTGQRKSRQTVSYGFLRRGGKGPDDRIGRGDRISESNGRSTPSRGRYVQPVGIVNRQFVPLPDGEFPASPAKQSGSGSSAAE